MKTLCDLQVGELAQVLRLSSTNPIYRQKLLSMGLIPGTQIVIKRVAPLGDPIEISVRGYGLSLRKNEASLLEIEKVSQDGCD